MAGVDTNSVVIVGNLTRDPELRALPSGTKVCSLRIAVNDMPNRQSGDQHTNFLDVTAFGPQAETHEKYLAKGRKIAVQGRIRTREYENKEGQKRSAFEVVADNVQYLSSPNGNGGSQEATKAADEPARSGEAPAEQQGLTGDDIPF